MFEKAPKASTYKHVYTPHQRYVPTVVEKPVVLDEVEETKLIGDPRKRIFTASDFYEPNANHLKRNS